MAALSMYDQDGSYYLKLCHLEINRNGKSMWNLAIQLVKIYLHNHNANGYQSWQGGDLWWGAPTHNDAWPFYYVVF